jgi:hypothetical protein
MGSALHRGPDADFGLTDFQAAAFPGNFAAESSYFNSLQEKDPKVAGSKGGWGHAQWTGPRQGHIRGLAETERTRCR